MDLTAMDYYAASETLKNKVRDIMVQIEEITEKELPEDVYQSVVNKMDEIIDTGTEKQDYLIGFLVSATMAMTELAWERKYQESLLGDQD